jgi:hypothetical protein
MAHDARPPSSTRAAEPADYAVFGLGANVSEQIVTGIVVSIAVMIVALIAVLMGMA